MRTIVSLLTAAVLLLVGSSQALAVNRAVATDCPNGNNLRAWKVVPGDNSWVLRDSGVPCNGWVPDPWGKPWYVLNRPQTDLEAAARSAAVWWGHCTRQESGSYWGGQTAYGGTPGFYYKWYNVIC